MIYRQVAGNAEEEEEEEEEANRQRERRCWCGVGVMHDTGTGGEVGGNISNPQHNSNSHKGGKVVE